MPHAAPLRDVRASVGWPLLSRLLLGGLLACLAGCQFDPSAASYTRAQPKPADLVGTYAPTATTRQYVEREGQYPNARSRVVLRADGTVQLENIPDWWLTDFGRSGGSRLSATGGWHIERNGEAWELRIDMPAGQGPGQFQASGLSTAIFLVGERPPYRLHFIVGDPDSGDAMQYELVGAAT